MSSRSALKHLGSQVAGAAAAAAIVAVSVIYMDETRALVRTALGIPSPEELARASAARAPAEEAAPARQQVRDNRTVELRAGAHGHFHADVDVNGRAISVMVDTGASIVALTWDDARRAGVHVRDSDFTHRVSTANGVARVAPVTLERVAIGEIMIRDVRAAVAEPGKLSTSLLGMSFLGRLSRTEMSRGVLILAE
jgi:aspartyl protease family protein